MAKRKFRTKEDIEREIIDFVENLLFPTTSTEIGRAVKLNWFTTKRYLDRLKKEGKLHLKKVGRQNQWWIGDVREQKNIAKKAAKIEENNLKFKEEIKELKDDNLNLKDDNLELKEKVKELKNDNFKLKEDNLKIREDNLKMKEDNLKMKEKIEKVEKRIHQLES